MRGLAPGTSSRVEDLGDRLIVRFRPHASRTAIPFLIVCLAFLTFVGVAMVSELAGQDWSGRAHLLFWLFWWGFGECVAILALAWHLLGREVLTVSSQDFEVRKEIGRFARTKRYDLALVHHVIAEIVPTNDDEKPPREDFCLEVAYDGKTVRIGEGMREDEAEYVVSTVLSRMKPRSQWTHGGRDDPYAWYGWTSPDPGVARGGAAFVDVSRPRLRAAVVAAALVAGGALGVKVIVLPAHDEPAPKMARTPAPERNVSAPPSEREFSDPRKFASAMTSFSLGRSGTEVLARPDCGRYVTWTAWKCSVRARATIGPFAGRALRYRCLITYTPQPGGGPAARGILCGPETAPS